MPTVQAPTVQATVQDFSARQTQEMGQATASLGVGLQRIAVQLQDDINEAEAKNGDVKIGDFIEQKTYDENGYFTKVGAEALGKSRQELLDGVRSESSKIASTMPNAMARRMYERSAQARIERLENQALGYAFEQTQKAKQDATANRMLRLSRDQVAYADSWNLPGSAYQKTRAVWEGEFAALLKQRNLAPDSDQALNMREDALAAIHNEVINSFVTKNRIGEAAQYLDKYRGEMPADMVAKVQDGVTKAGINDQAAKVAIGLRGTDMSLKQRNDALVAMFESNKIPAEVLAQARNIVAYDFNLERLELERTQSQALQEGMNWVLANPGKPLSLAPPAVQKQVFDNDVLGKINKAIEAQNELNNSKAMFEVRSMANSDEGLKALRDMTPDQFALKYMPQMNSQDFSYAKSLHASARGEATPEQQRLHSLEDRVLLGAVEAGIISKMPGKDAQLNSKEKLALTRWQKDFSNKIATQTAATGKAPTDAEIQNMIDQEVILRTTKVQLDQFGLDPERVLSEIVGDERLMQNAYVRNRDGSIYYISQARKLQPGELGLTEQVMEQLKKELQAQGLAASPTNAIWLWLKQQGMEPK